VPSRATPSRRALTVGAIGLLVVTAVVAGGLALTSSPWHRVGGPLAVSGWAPYWQTGDAFDSFSTHADLFADVSIVAWSATGVDTVVQSEQLATDALGRFTARARIAGVPVLATVNDDTPSGVMAGILADPVTRHRHVATLVATARAAGVAGLDIDYERFAFSDPRSTWAGTRPNWVAFVQELAAALHAAHLLLTVSVPPIYDDGTAADTGYWVYDHAEIGKVVDRLRIMAYDYSTSAPGPIAPIDWIAGIARAEARLVAPAKLDLGLAVYGYDWPTVESGACPADAPSKRRSLSQRAIDTLLAERQLVPVQLTAVAEAEVVYDETLTGADATGAETTCSLHHVLRWIDAAGIDRRARIADREQLHGVAIWSLGDESAAAWTAIRLARAGTPAATSSTTTSPTGASTTTSTTAG
jgi:spore germination protein YaaH